MGQVPAAGAVDPQSPAPAWVSALPQTRLKILHVIPTYYPAVRYGGPIRSVHGLCSALARRGHQVQVYTTSVDGDTDLDVPVRQAVMIDGVAVHYHRVPALRRLYWSPALAAQLHRSMADFDVVHLHSVYLWPTCAAARAAEAASVPYLLSPRGQLVRELIHAKSRWLKSAWIRLIERRTLRACAALHVTTALEGNEIRSLGLAPPTVFTIPNGVSWPDAPLPLSAGPFAGIPRPYCLFLGRINWKKGLDRLIAAWKLVPELPLLIAGNDEEEYLPALRALAEAEGVTDRIHFLGEVSDTHKWALYQNAELLVLPSSNENFGNVVVEALAMACPVIVTPGVGLAPFVREAGAGLVADGAPSSLAEAVQRLLAEPAMRREMGKRGQSAVFAELSWNAVAERMEAVYRQICAAHPKAGIS